MIYPPAFEKAVKLILELEGGFTANQADPGNWTGGKVGAGALKGTMYGISAASYPQLDIRNLTLGDAKAIYYRDYWEKVGADNLPPALGLCAFDTAVNSGVKRAQNLLRLTQDYVIFHAERQRLYTEFDAWPTFGRGWTRRLVKVLQAARELEAASRSSRLEIWDDGEPVSAIEIPPGRSVVITQERDGGVSIDLKR